MQAALDRELEDSGGVEEEEANHTAIYRNTHVGPGHIGPQDGPFLQWIRMILLTTFSNRV